MIDHLTYTVMAHRIRMLVRDWQGAQPPVLFLHHITANSIEALRLARTLNGRRRLIAPDLRGRGGSDMPFGEYGLAAHYRELVDALARLNISQCAVVGHSFGAMLGVWLAAHSPERVSHLVLIDGGAPPNPREVQALNAYYDTMPYRYPSLEAYIERFKTHPLYQPYTEELDLLLRSNLRQQPDGSYIRCIARYVLDAERSPTAVAQWMQLPELYPRVRCPVLILRAGMGIFSPTEPVLTDDILAMMQAGMPQAEILTIPEAAHTTIVTMPHAERDAAILRFLGVSE
ncbi:MAG: alpha/beta hydrolase [Anaerolineae bacterium]|nr:alpha/beta hydrolase [Anaerolineae bacterium]MDW8298660.1 alpha/beta hydrolase [Anaerolineae bacterium]